MLTALIDVVSRGWSLSPFLETQSCVQAFEMAILLAFPLIINSDQGSHFTSGRWIETMTHYRIKVSMNGQGRCLNHVYIERFWRSIKYEEVYLKAYDSLVEARQAITAYIEFYSAFRSHQALNYKTPNQVYEEKK